MKKQTSGGATIQLTIEPNAIYVANSLRNVRSCVRLATLTYGYELGTLLPTDGNFSTHFSKINK
ncbi:hypothetical protein NECAME_18777 [Necator americanus]|uniref:Uncharacterized protein n=1 Tax=Necator americanus TaxID=51031 RepID=W2SV71_NECAM|nr:hypothetical protein NECAME_18777 [Necator americanus]ETN72597.1 hypothetical protein NECAME_18777 [Necator americanus]